MKKIIISSILFLAVSAIEAQTNMGDKISSQIATRIKDSLLITDMQYNKILQVNTYLQNKKQKLRDTFTNLDSLQFHTQKVESMRDSLYKEVFNAEQYRLYKLKKRNLISNK